MASRRSTRSGKGELKQPLGTSGELPTESAVEVDLPIAGETPGQRTKKMATGVQITEQAAGRIKKLLNEDERDLTGLRLKVVGGGCSGLQYKMDLDNPKPTDRIFELAGAKVIVDLKSLLYLSGTELDYKETLMEAAFIFQNPNVKRSCGCGASFVV